MEVLKIERYEESLEVWESVTVPPIVRLALSFKRWIESINEEEKRDKMVISRIMKF